MESPSEPTRMTTPNPTESPDGTGVSSRSPSERPLAPGPTGYPIVGNAHRFVRDPFAFYDVLAEYGDVVRWRLGRRRFTTLFHPDHVERVLVGEPDHFERNLEDDFGFDFAPEGVLLVDGDQWRRQRRVLQPAFTVDRVRSYADAMVRVAERTRSGWTDGEALAVNRVFSDVSLEILAEALFALEVDPRTDEEAITRGARAINDRADLRGATAFLPDWVPTRANREYRRALSACRERVDELIDRRLADGPDGDDLLSTLLRAAGPDGAGLSREEVRDNLLTFAFAGHETTSLALTYTFLALSQHPDVRARLHEELEAVLAGDRPTVEHVPRLPYTEAVLREALRLYPPTPVMTRRAASDVVIGGYRIPAGTILSLPQFRLHADERFWDDPEAFDPDRWLEGDEDERPAYASFPFGGGPRHCIGMRFAMLELQLVVAAIAREVDFELLSDPDPELAAGATLKPYEDVRMRVHER